MFSHVMLGSNDLERSRRFYDALFAAVGGPSGAFDARGRLFYSHNGARLGLTRPIDGEAATCANGSTIGFAMASPEEAQAWHRAGVENGGRSIEDEPGVREGPGYRVYLAYLRDPDGHKLCGIHWIART